MGKPPAFQFYVRDWLSDPELQSASASSRGIWINALCYMWESRDRGKLEGTVQSLSRLLNCSEEEFKRFISESEIFHFDDLVTHQNGKVTLINRRMKREDKQRFFHNKRQDKYRKSHIINIGDTKGDLKVTPCSSSSSSSSTSKNKEYSAFFLDFWKTYPKKTNKKKAFKEWNDAKDKPTLEVILEIIQKQIAFKQNLRESNQFCPEWPDPERWIKNARWEDEIDGGSGSNMDPVESLRQKARVQRSERLKNEAISRENNLGNGISKDELQTKN